jgi:hypothetical protein
MLADAAQVHQGKLFVLGGGIAAFPPTPPDAAAPVAIAGVITVPWEEANKQHTLVLDLVDLDNQPYLVNTPTGEAGFRAQANFSTAPHPHIRRGSMLVVPVAMQFALPLRSGDYRFTVKLNGEEIPDAVIPMYVIAPQNAPTA